MDQPRPMQCPSCRWWTAYVAIIGREQDTHYRCAQGVPGAGKRVDCTRYQREPGTED